MFVKTQVYRHHYYNAFQTPHDTRKCVCSSSPRCHDADKLPNRLATKHTDRMTACDTWKALFGFRCIWSYNNIFEHDENVQVREEDQREKGPRMPVVLLCSEHMLTRLQVIAMWVLFVLCRELPLSMRLHMGKLSEWMSIFTICAKTIYKYGHLVWLKSFFKKAINHRHYVVQQHNVFARLWHDANIKRLFWICSGRAGNCSINMRQIYMCVVALVNRNCPKQ